MNKFVAMLKFNGVLLLTSCPIVEISVLPGLKNVLISYVFNSYVSTSP